MKFRDLLKMCLHNLRQRKGRTILTVIGVMIGCASITIMMSFGFGMSEMQEKRMSSMGNLRMIQINSWQNENFNDAMIAELAALDSVEAITPLAEMQEESVQVRAGSNDRYLCQYAPVIGIDFSLLEALGIELVSGSVPDSGGSSQKPRVLLGENFAYSFQDTMRPEGSNMINPYPEPSDGSDWYYDIDGNLVLEDGTIVETQKNDPYFDPMTVPLRLELSLYDEGAKPLRLKAEPAGITKTDYNLNYATDSGILMDIKEFNQLRRQLYHDNGQAMPARRYYQQGLVLAKTVDDVEPLETQLRSLGLDTYSEQSSRKAMQESMRSSQMMLGGIGAISFLVAAIGIANTMIMTVTERTREIGIMKSIGCRVRDVRLMFLFEAGMIGLLGGLCGLLLSFAASCIINALTAVPKVTDFTTFWKSITAYGGRISVIPLSMVFSALLFSMLVGIVSGYYPAHKASRISSLEAIRQ